MKRNELVKYLDEFLKIDEIEDASSNGLQIEGREQVGKVALAVDFCIESAKEAARTNSDLLLVHHGLIWNGLKNIKGNTYRRVKIMMESEIGLYAAHLPLDLHPEVGNNVEIARLLAMPVSGTFGKRKGKDLGVWGEFESPIELSSLERKIALNLKTECTVFPFGGEKVRTIGIISGGGGYHLIDAIEKKLDAFLTGEMGHSIYHLARENEITLIRAGHYATETLGVMALGKHIKNKFNLKTVFIDVPTGL